jgi:hypothetical protein
MEIPEGVKGQLGELIGPMFGDNQFYQIVQFMTGRWGEGLVDEEKAKPGTLRCLLLVYAGPNATSRASAASSARPTPARRCRVPSAANSARTSWSTPRTRPIPSKTPSAKWASPGRG